MMVRQRLSRNDQIRLNEVITEKTRRNEEALQLYRPQPSQEPFHRSQAQQRVVRGGNRSGKTTAAVAEVCSACTKTQLRDSHGKPLPFNYPADRPLLVWVIGIDENHLARVFRKMFRKGVFRVISDEKTGKLRSWRPWDASDHKRRSETQESPPFIPERMVENIAWINKGEGIPSLVVLKNGTRIHFFPSGGVPGMGDPVDILFIDEDVRYPEHVPEWIGRLPDAGKGTTPDGRWVEGGRFIWSAWPHSHNDALQTMCRLAKEEARSEDPIAFEIILKFHENPFISDKLKAQTIKSWGAYGSSVVRARDLGDFLTDSVLWYPNFNAEIHGIPRRSGPDILETALADGAGRIPKTWTNYLGLDPGHTHPALVVLSVPPPQVGDFFLVWREICHEGASAQFIAKEVKRICWDMTFEAFFIDGHAARQSYQGQGGYTIGQHYSAAFKEAGLSSRRTGSTFMPGSDDITARNMLLRSWMDERDDGTTKFRIDTAHCPETIDEFARYKKRVTREDVTDKEVSRFNHCISAICYVASRHPKWMAPVPETSEDEHPLNRLMASIPYVVPPRQASNAIYMGPGASPVTAP